MPNAIVLGSQWGDEGKGKVVDRLASEMDLVVRFQGGANAGHTVVVDGTKFVLHLVPSGILNSRSVNVIGNGCVVDILQLSDELSYLMNAGISVSPERLRVSGSAHMVTPFHRHLDSLTGGHVGTTGRGIGPTYVDKVRRTGVRLEALVDGSWKDKIAAVAGLCAGAAPRTEARPFPELDRTISEMEPHVRAIAPYIADTQTVIHACLKDCGNILYEGAQGTLLDIDHGTYPFVTSSSTTIGGAFTGSGVFVEFQQRIAVVKAYTTRVGNGPFPTELDNETGRDLQRRGHEFGATTGRPRRCGWLDIPLLRRSFIANGFNQIALTKLDCLTGIDPIRVAVGRGPDGTPEYLDLPGWQEEIAGASTIEDLPARCLAYVRFIEQQLDAPVTLLSTGPERHQTLIQERI